MRARMQPSVEAGFTLVEVLVSLLLLTTLACGMALLVGLGARAIERARLETVAVVLAQRRLEQLRSLAWGFGSVHAPAAGVDRTTDLSTAEPTGGGGGLTPVGPGALDSDTPGSVDYLDRSGRWIGHDARTPAARFTRRWSIEAIPGWPDMLLLRVRVIDQRAVVPDVLFSLARTRSAR